MMKNKIVLLLSLLSHFCLFAQLPDDVSVKFQDRHSSDVTQILFHPNGKYFFTGDEAGKILMWNTNDYSFRKTISKSRNGRPIRSMGFRANGTVLIVAEGNQGKMNYRQKRTGFLSTEYDSLAYYFPFENKPPVRTALSFDLFHQSTDSVLLCAVVKEGQNYLIGFYDAPDEGAMFHFQTKSFIYNAAISVDLKTVCFAEFNVNGNSSLNILDLNNDSLVHNEEIKGDIIHLYFDETMSVLHIFSHNIDDEMIYVSDLSLKNLKITKTQKYPFTFAISCCYAKNSDQLELLLLSEFSKPLFLKKDARSVVGQHLEFNESAITAAALVPYSDHIIYWKSAPYLSNNPELIVWDRKAELSLYSYSISTRSKQKSYFLPDNSWLIEGNQSYSNNFLPDSPINFFKYYEQGTLRNRFERLNFHDYLKVKHLVKVPNAFEYTIDEYSGNMVFMAHVPKKDSLYEGETKYQYVIYDLQADTIDFSLGAEEPNWMPIQYRDGKKRILARTTSWAKTKDFVVLGRNEKNIFKEKFVDAELSLSGDFIILLDTNQMIHAYQLESNKLIYQRKLNGNNFKLGAADENGFYISYDFWNAEQRVVQSQTIFLDYQGNEFNETIHENVQLTGLSYKNNKLALIFKNLGIFFENEKYLLFPENEFPDFVSLNEDATRLIVSLNNGLIKIYNTESLELIGTMLHPDEKSHVIIDNRGHFISNTDIRKHLFAEQANVFSNIEAICDSYNQPQEVLKIFGNPEADYYKLLEKASQIRKTRNEKALVQRDSKVVRPQILEILLNGQKSLSVSETNNISVTLEVLDRESAITELEIRLNGVKQPSEVIKNKIQKEKPGTIVTRLELVSGENLIECSVINEKGIKSKKIERIVICNKEDNSSDLYLLAVGVSEYQSKEYNLTFADKDALDISILYGDTNTIDMNDYKQRYWGNRYHVAGSSISNKNNEIRYYGGTYFSQPQLFQADYNGNYWIQATQEKFMLWNFEASKIEEIPIPLKMNSFLSLNNETFIAEPDNNFFFFQGEDKQWYRFSINEKKSNKFEIPFNEKCIPLSKGSWACIESNTEYINDEFLLKVQLKIAHPDGSSWDIKEKEVVFENTMVSPELLSVSREGEQFLITIDNEIWHILINENSIQKTLIKDFRHSYGNTYFFNEHTRQITCLKKVYENDNGGSYEYFIFEPGTDKIDSSTINNHDFSIIGANNIGGNLKWIASHAPIANSKSNTLIDELEERSKIQPVSFKKIHIMNLTNSQATKEGILDKMEMFLSKAGINDQVMVFFAGHGLIDSSFNYYFAPHDMNFEKPELNGISYVQIIELMNKIPALRKLLIMDSCHSGNIFDEGEKPGTEIMAMNESRGVSLINSSENSKIERVSDLIDILFNNLSSTSGITVLAASSGEDVAFENREISNGALTSALINELESKFKNYFYIDTEKLKEILLTDEFIYNLQKDVIINTQGKQIPNMREVNRLSEISIW